MGKIDKMGIMNVLFIIILIIIIALIGYYAYNYFDNITINSTNNNQLTTKTSTTNNQKASVKCGKNGCPTTNDTNDIYKVYEKYKLIRQKNHLLSHKSLGGGLFSRSRGPSNIFIVRHGERIKGGEALDCNGILRSTYIPNLIENINNSGFGINAIISTNDYGSMHQQQTVMLTCWLLNIPLFIYGESNSTQIAVHNLFNNIYYEGKTVLFCWEHTCIQNLINHILTTGPKLMGLTNYKFMNPEGNSKLPHWDPNNFKSIIHFDDKLNFNLLEENFTSCYTEENNIITYGKYQSCDINMI